MRRPAAPERITRQIGRRIAELRRAQGLTQAELASKLDVTTPWVSRVERRGENLMVATLVKIANAIGVEPRELWEKPGPGAPPVRRGRPPRPR